MFLGLFVCLFVAVNMVVSSLIYMKLAQFYKILKHGISFSLFRICQGGLQHGQ